LLLPSVIDLQSHWPRRPTDAMAGAALPLVDRRTLKRGLAFVVRYTGSRKDFNCTWMNTVDTHTLFLPTGSPFWRTAHSTGPRPEQHQATTVRAMVLNAIKGTDIVLRPVSSGECTTAGGEQPRWPCVPILACRRKAEKSRPPKNHLTVSARSHPLFPQTACVLRSMRL
jgi:hypothetical protein